MAQDACARRALFAAIREHNHPCVSRLLSGGADADASDEAGSHPAHTAVASANLPAVGAALCVCVRVSQHLGRAPRLGSCTPSHTHGMTHVPLARRVASASASTRRRRVRCSGCVGHTRQWLPPGWHATHQQRCTCQSRALRQVLAHRWRVGDAPARGSSAAVASNDLTCACVHATRGMFCNTRHVVQHPACLQHRDPHARCLADPATWEL